MATGIRSVNNMSKLCLFSALLLVSSCYASDDDVLDLSSNTLDSFKAEIGVYDAILIEFFAPW